MGEHPRMPTIRFCSSFTVINKGKYPYYMMVDGEEFDIINPMDLKTYALKDRKNYALHNKKINEQEGVHFSFVRPKKRKKKDPQQKSISMDSFKFREILRKNERT